MKDSEYEALKRYIERSHPSLMGEEDDSLIEERYKQIKEGITSDTQLSNFISQLESFANNEDPNMTKRTVVSLFCKPSTKATKIVVEDTYSMWQGVEVLKSCIREKYPSLLITPDGDLNSYISRVKEIAGDDPLLRPLLNQAENSQNGDILTMFMYLFVDNPSDTRTKSMNTFK